MKNKKRVKQIVSVVMALVVVCVNIAPVGHAQADFLGDTEHVTINVQVPPPVTPVNTSQSVRTETFEVGPQEHYVLAEWDAVENDILYFWYMGEMTLFADIYIGPEEEWNQFKDTGYGYNFYEAFPMAEEVTGLRIPFAGHWFFVFYNDSESSFATYEITVTYGLSSESIVATVTEALTIIEITTDWETTTEKTTIRETITETTTEKTMQEFGTPVLIMCVLFAVLLAVNQRRKNK